MLGHRLWLDLSKKYDVTATVRSVSPFPELKSVQLPNILDFTEVEKIVQKMRPDVVINCIGLIKQASDHDNAIMNIELNALLPNKLAKICENSGSRLILMSTDCVFSGKKGMYGDFDFADADDVYGRTKKLGEIENSKHVLTIRTSIIGRELRGNASLIDWFLSQENKQIKGFTKAIFSGFPTRTIAKILDQYILNNLSLSGIYNISADPISKYDLLKLVQEETGIRVDIVPYHDFQIDRSLDSSRFRSATQFSPQPWKELIKDIFVTDIKYKGQK